MGVVFKFKQFEVNQRDCAMKINTDGVLLGAMVGADNPERILDVGSGTGVIALMLAQRFPSAIVDAVDIDETAYKRTQENFRQSKFNERMNAHHGDFEVVKEIEAYDLIVSNPPFYINALHNPDNRKRLARHTDLVFFRRLLHFSKNRLSQSGTLQLILPTDLSEDIMPHAQGEGLILINEIRIQSFYESEPIRKILTFSKQGLCSRETTDFVIYQKKGVYSEAYQRLLKSFFLGF